MNILQRFRRTEAPADEATRIVQFRYDRVLMAVTLVLMGLGVVMVYSASIVTAEARTGDGTYYLERQAIFCGLGLCLLVATLNIHHDLWRRIAPTLFAIALLLLIVVLIPGISATAKGASRWIDLGPLRFQPSESIKLTWIILLAWFLSQKQAELDSLKTAWGKPLLAYGAIAALLMLQPDFGTTLICGGIMVLMIWAAGARWLHVGGLFVLGALLIPVAILAEPYRVKRLLSFLDPEHDPQGASYHINQALISFGSGDWTGMGLGNSRQKLLYLPEAHTDFVFSIYGEEFGWVGVAVVIALFATFIWRGFAIARKAPTAFGALLAFGITGQIGFQAATNMAVATALLPTKGLTLPFISYGGSAMLLICAAVGILLNISRQEPPPAWLHHYLPDADVKQKRGLIPKAPKTRKTPPAPATGTATGPATALASGTATAPAPALASAPATAAMASTLEATPARRKVTA